MSRGPLPVTGVLLAAVLLGGCSATVVGSPSPLFPVRPAVSDGGSGSASGSVSGSAEPVPWPPATIPESAREDPEVVDFGFSAFDVADTGKVISYGVRVRNPNPSSWLASSVGLSLAFTDDAGRLLYEDRFAVVYTLPPDTTSAVGGTAIGGALATLVEQPTAMSVEITAVNWFSTDDVPPGRLVMDEATVRPRAGSVIVGCTADSSYRSALSSGSVAVLFLDGRGRIIGGNSDNTTIDGDFIRIPGQAATDLQLELEFAPPGGVPEAICYPNVNVPL